MNKVCSNCKVIFLSWSSSRKFCSRKCSTAFYKENYIGKDSKNYGTSKNPDTRELIRQAKVGSKNPMFGKKPWNKGIALSFETREKISKTKQERIKSGLIRIWNGGKKTNQKVWNKGLNKKTSPVIAKLSKKLSKLRQEQLKNPEFKEKFRQKSSVSHKGYYKKNPQALEKLKQIRSKIIYPKKDSSIEKKLQNALNEQKVNFLTHYPFYNENCETKIDITIPQQKIAIYCDGDYWHNLPNYKLRDKRINFGLQKAGWKVIRFWGSEINSNVDECVNKIMELIKR